jgi:tetratricopeptide (TPR) repeat protein
MSSAPHARRLLSLLALLPGGLAEPDVRGLISDRGTLTRSKANEAINSLHQLRLVERRPDLRLRVITPLRECLRRDVPANDSDLRRLIDHYLRVAERASSIGSSGWSKAREEVETEIDNLDPICELAVEISADHPRLDKALSGLAELHRFSGRGAKTSLERAAVKFRARSLPLRAANASMRLARIAFLRSDLEAAHTRFTEALGLYREVDSEPGEANAIYGLSNIAETRSQNETASKQVAEALSLYRRNKDTLGEANCIHALGNIAAHRSDYETARAQFAKALSLYRDIGRNLGEANCIYSLGKVAFVLSDVPAALDHSENALSLFREIGSVIGEANCISSKGRIASARGDVGNARVLINESLVLYRRVGEILGEANGMLELGDLASSESEYEVAKGLYAIALGLYERGGRLSGVANYKYSCGRAAFDTGEYELAKTNFEEARDLYRRIDRLDMMAVATVRLGQLQCQMGDMTLGIAEIDAGFRLFFQDVDARDRALPGWHSLHRALTAKDPIEAANNRQEARAAWTAIDRHDMVRHWID